MIRNFLRILVLASLLCMSMMAFAQQRISGKVKDSGGEPLIGVNIVEIGTTNGTVTDIDGNYTIRIGKNAKLQFSFIGYVTQELKAKPNMMVILEEDSEKLDEVVVVGYGSMQRKDVTSSITTLKSDDLNSGVMTSPGQMLQGKVPGLVVTTSGNPNAAPSITLRGASTLRTGEAQSPYYIVDGIPGVDLSLVSADDIESIDVLRDATATAIYGSKAANGVIIITTKKGKRGVAHVTYNGYVAIDQVSKNLDLATASDLRNYAQTNNFELSSDAGANTDWQKEVVRTGIAHNHNVGVSGGNEKSNYNVSLNYLNQEGIIRGTDMTRFTARAMAQSTVLKDHLTLSLGVNASQTTGNEVPTGGSGESVTDAMIYYSPTQPIRNADNSWFRSSSVSQYYNPLSMINEDTYKNIYKRMQVTGKVDLKLIEGLTWSSNFSYMTDQQTSNSYHSTQSQIVNSHGEATRNTLMGNKLVFETYGNYQVTLADKHKLGVMAGYSWEESNNNDGFGVTVKNFYNDEVKYHNLSYANTIDGMDGVASSAESTLRMISFYGRANYSFNSKYNLQATIRRDGSSAFGKNNRWATFPSFSAAWRASEEPFIQQLGIFDDLKLRVGYGVSGNSLGFDAYTALPTYGVTGWFQYTDASGVTSNMHTLGANNNSNPDLKWERTGMFNVGLDFGFFENRLSGTVEYYDKRTSDLIYYYPVSTNRYPFGTMTANVGDISNKGIEVTINAVPVETQDFSWDMTVNLSHNKNMVKKLSNQTYSVNYIPQADAGIAGNSGVYLQRIMEGCPIGQFYTYEWAGYNEQGVSQFYVHDPETGERTGETTTSPKETDQTKTGSAQPKLTYGWNNTLNWKKWSLNLFFQGTVGNKIFNALRAQYNSVNLISQGKNVLKEALTDQKYGDVNAQYPSDRYLENGSYLRLATLTLSYNLGQIGDWVSNLSLYATCNNLFTITGYKGTDPEVELGGLTPGIEVRDNYYPHTRTFLLGMKLNF
ncbi:TonB-dependent receptor [Parabacteroides distasonis]|nr:TonB-dependent receptor [Parabacteroides distasonis]